MMTNHKVNPGVYRDVPFEEYLAWDCANNSTLKDLEWSPAHAKWRRENDSYQTSAMRLGNALHCALLEPHEFAKRFGRLPEGDGRTRVVKEARAEFEIEGRTALSPSEWDRVLDTSAACYDHEIAGSMMRLIHDTELSAVADLTASDDSTVRVKVRADAWCPAARTVVDVKTTRDLSDRGLQSTMARFGYHRQAWMYLETLTQAGLEADRFMFLWVNSTPGASPDQMIRTTTLPEAAMLLGAAQTRDALAVYNQCVSTGHWPGRPQATTEIDLPYWVYVQHEEK